MIANKTLTEVLKGVLVLCMDRRNIDYEYMHIEICNLSSIVLLFEPRNSIDYE